VYEGPCTVNQRKELKITFSIGYNAVANNTGYSRVGRWSIFLNAAQPGPFKNPKYGESRRKTAKDAERRISY